MDTKKYTIRITCVLELHLIIFKHFSNQETQNLRRTVKLCYPLTVSEMKSLSSIIYLSECVCVCDIVGSFFRRGN